MAPSHHTPPPHAAFALESVRIDHWVATAGSSVPSFMSDSASAPFGCNSGTRVRGASEAACPCRPVLCVNMKRGLPKVSLKAEVQVEHIRLTPRVLKARSCFQLVEK